MADDIEIKPISPTPSFADDWPAWAAWAKETTLEWMMKEYMIPQHMLGLPGQKEDMTELVQRIIPKDSDEI